jgi:aflatoxin B1 aldehyde reductase
MAHSTPKIVFGTAGIKSLEPQVLTDMLDTLDKHDVKELDTANLYV